MPQRPRSTAFPMVERSSLTANCAPAMTSSKYELRAMTRHIVSTQRFPQKLVSGFRASLPSRLQFSHPAERLLVEVEVLLHEGLREMGRRAMQKLPGQIDFPIGKSCGAQLPVNLLHELRLLNIQVDPRQVRVLVIAIPIEVGRELL